MKNFRAIYCDGVAKRAAKLADKIGSAENWLDVIDEVTELCELAGLGEEWREADGDTFEEVINRAAEVLNVRI